ncbi:MAG: hypothetical protein K2X80_08285 [Pseudomonadaceae bacterium]|nr:hypothetical protein [Pseudomonadaceae bacterium]
MCSDVKTREIKKLSTIVGALVLATLCIIVVSLHAKYGYSWPSSGHAFGSDDAFISYRYAANLFNGTGLVFNPGEAVEGYSNFLYTLLMVPGFFLGYEHIYLFSLTINTLLFVVCCFVLQYLIRQELGALYAWIGSGMLALTPVLWANAATGLESMLVLFLFLLVWALLSQTKPRVAWLCIAALAAILCRVDGFILPLLAALCLWLDGRRKLGYQLVAFVFLVMTAYTSWRLFYYSDYIANTYHAKITGNVFERIKTGFEILYGQSIYNGIALYAAISITAAVLHRSITSKHLFPLTYLIFSLLYFICIGGDIYYERFLLAIFPVGVFFTLLMSSKAELRVIKVALPLIAVLAGSLVAFQGGRFAYQSKSYDMWNNLGRFLAGVEPGSLLAIDAAGKVPYYSNLPTLDMLGLNDRHIGQRDMPPQPFLVGHAKHDVDYVLSRKPVLIAVWGLANLDLRWGLTREKYISNYEVKYLVNSLMESRGQDIVDVQGATVPEIKNLMESGYYYVVLARRDQLSLLPKASEWSH